MNEEELQARLAQMQAQLAQTQQLAQQYGLAPQQASQWMQVYNQLANSGRFSGSLSDYFAQRSQGPVPTPGYNFPTPPEPPPPGLLDPPQPGTGGTTPPPPVRGDGTGRTPRDPYQPPEGGRPDIPTIPTLPPPPRGDMGPGGPGRGPSTGGQAPNVTLPPANVSDTLASFGYMRGPNGEILPQMLQGGWSPYQDNTQRQPPPSFNVQPGAGGLQLPQLGYDQNQQGYTWFTPPPQQSPVPGAGNPPAGTTTPAPPMTGTGPGPGANDNSLIPKLGLLGQLGGPTLPPSLRGLLG